MDDTGSDGARHARDRFPAATVANADDDATSDPAGIDPADPFDEMADGRTILRRLGLAFAVMIGSLTAIGLGLTRFGPLEPVLDWDESVNVALADNRSEWASTLARRVSEAGDTAPIIGAMLLVTVALAFGRHWRAMTFVPMAIVLEIVTFIAVNTAVGRPRPDVERLGPLPGTDSFPSGHIAATFVCWFGAAALLTMYGRVGAAKVVAVVGAVMTVAMGWARVYVGMHHLVDVIVGLAMGIAALAFAVHVLGVRIVSPAGQSRMT